jgi:protein TonB
MGATYPPESLKAGEQGTVDFRVDVSETGIPENCVILKTSGYPRLDQATCDLILKTARFKPALDLDGKPTRATFTSKTKWVIPAK